MGCKKVYNEIIVDWYAKGMQYLRVGQLEWWLQPRITKSLTNSVLYIYNTTTLL